MADEQITTPIEMQGKTLKEITLDVWCEVVGISKRLDRLDVVVRGDPAYNARGLVAAVDDHERRVVALEGWRESLKNQSKGLLVGVALGSAGIGATVGAVVSSLFGG